MVSRRVARGKRCRWSRTCTVANAERPLMRLRAIGAAALVLTARATTGAHAQTEQPEGRPWSGTVGIGTTAVSANNVLPVPAALGASLLVERGPFGVEGAVHADAATLCDRPSDGEGYCGLLWIFDIAPRATL